MTAVTTMSPPPVSQILPGPPDVMRRHRVSCYHGTSRHPEGIAMAKENSFDIVSEPDLGEVTNAVDQTRREVAQRYDFRGHDVTITWDRDRTIILEAPAGMVMDALLTVLEQKMARRGVSLRFLEIGPREPRGNDRARVTIALRRGLTNETAKQIAQAVRGLKLKVDPQIQANIVRVSGKSKDDLQAVIAALKQQDFGVELAFTNYR